MITLDQITDALTNSLVKRGMQPELADFEVYSRESAIVDGVDDEDSFFLEEGDSRTIEWYILYNDNPDYCLLFTHYTPGDAAIQIDKWFNEIGIQ